MNKYTCLLLALLLAIDFNALAQEETPVSTVSNTLSSLDLSGSFGAETFGASIAFSRTHGVLKSKKLRIGYGLRLSGMSGSNLTYISAPLRLTQDPALIDTFQIGSPTNAALNAVIHLGYMFNNKWEVGFNIDALGVGFGRTNIGTFISSDNNGVYPQSVRATPTPFSLLLVGDNDIGYLKSEFVVAYRPTSKIKIRAGADYTFSEYTTIQELTNENARFRYKAAMAFIGFSYILEQ